MSKKDIITIAGAIIMCIVASLTFFIKGDKTIVPREGTEV